MRLLILEDNLNLSEWLAKLLRRENYVVDCLEEGEAVLQGADLSLYDLAIVDLGLPGVGGIEVVRALRRQGHSLPILILTAEDALQSRVAGLNAGADDYVTKPFEVEELVARLRALLRRRAAPVARGIDFGPLAFEEAGRLFTLAGSPLALSPKEHAILEALLRRAGMTVSKETLLDAAYGYDEEVNPQAVEVVVHRLRKKLEGSAVSIATLRGFGYILRLEA